jgi:hypothetical protein
LLLSWFSPAAFAQVQEAAHQVATEAAAAELVAAELAAAELAAATPTKPPSTPPASDSRNSQGRAPLGGGAGSPSSKICQSLHGIMLHTPVHQGRFDALLKELAHDRVLMKNVLRLGNFKQDEVRADVRAWPEKQDTMTELLLARHAMMTQPRRSPDGAAGSFAKKLSRELAQCAAGGGSTAESDHQQSTPKLIRLITRPAWNILMAAPLGDFQPTVSQRLLLAQEQLESARKLAEIVDLRCRIEALAEHLAQLHAHEQLSSSPGMPCCAAANLQPSSPGRPRMSATTMLTHFADLAGNAHRSSIFQCLSFSEFRSLVQLHTSCSDVLHNTFVRWCRRAELQDKGKQQPRLPVLLHQSLTNELVLARMTEAFRDAVAELKTIRGGHGYSGRTSSADSGNESD